MPKKTKEGINVRLNDLGYDKLLAKGQVTHPLIVQVDACSKSAAKKIVEAGGKILKPGQWIRSLEDWVMALSIVKDVFSKGFVSVGISLISKF